MTAVARPRVRRPGAGEPVGWGIVGCGWVARDHALPALLAVPGARLVGAYDRDPAVAAGLAGAVRSAPDLTTLLDRDEVHAVYVATPNNAHTPAVRAAAERGIAVLCEKPLAADVPDAAALVQACEGAGVLAGTAFDQRHHPAHRRVADLVAAGELGTVTAVRITYGCWLPADWSPDGRVHDNWRIDPARAGGGALVDLAPHGIDLVGALLGDDLDTLQVLTHHRVHDYARNGGARNGGAGNGGTVDDGAVLAGRTAAGVLFTAHVSYNTADALPRRRLEVVGTRAQLVATDTMGQTAGGRLARFDARTGEVSDIAFDRSTSPFRAQLAAFTAAVAGHGYWPWPLRRDLYLHTLLHSATPSAPRS